MENGIKEGSYGDILDRFPIESAISAFERMNARHIPVEYGVIPRVVFEIQDGTSEVIAWLIEHGHGQYAGNVPFHAEEYLLRDVVLSTIRQEKFPTNIWFEKLEALLRGGVNPNPVVENDYGHSLPLIDYASRYAARGSKEAAEVVTLLRRYND